MTLEAFEAAAQAAWERIPEQYKAGIDALVIEESSHTHPEHDEFFTLGECVTEAYPSEIGGPDTIRSAVVLYYGSFAEVAREADDFPWEAEIEETLLHELQHHLEQLADDEELTDLDHAVEENFKRVEGQAFDPFFYRAGQPLGDGLFRVEHDVFVELAVPRSAPAHFEFEWADEHFRVPIPQSDADVLFVVIEQEMPDVPGDFCVVRVRRMSALGTLRAAFTRRGFTSEQIMVEAELI
jgi:predicted Zn-dependent protease with MMP-like domain